MSVQHSSPGPHERCNDCTYDPKCARCGRDWPCPAAILGPPPEQRPCPVVWCGSWWQECKAHNPDLLTGGSTPNPTEATATNDHRSERPDTFGGV